MEISALPKNGLKIKGKHALLGVNPSDKTIAYNGAILLDTVVDPSDTGYEYMVIQGPGDYEVGGIKVAGTRGAADTVYSITVDGLEILLGKISSIEKLQQKLKEHNIVILNADQEVDSSFATGLAENTVIFYGDNAAIVKNLTKDTIKEMPKYQVTREKLPSEVETILLSS